MSRNDQLRIGVGGERLPNPSDLIVADLKERFDEQAAAPAFNRLYDDPEFGHMFAQRYQTVLGLIADVERLDATPTGGPA